MKHCELGSIALQIPHRAGGLWHTVNGLTRSRDKNNNFSCLVNFFYLHTDSSIFHLLFHSWFCLAPLLSDLGPHCARNRLFNPSSLFGNTAFWMVLEGLGSASNSRLALLIGLFAGLSVQPGILFPHHVFTLIFFGEKKYR